MTTTEHQEGVMTIDAQRTVADLLADIPNLGTWSELTGDECPAGGGHAYSFESPRMGVPAFTHCLECGAEPPSDNDDSELLATPYVWEYDPETDPF